MKFHRKWVFTFMNQYGNFKQMPVRLDNPLTFHDKIGHPTGCRIVLNVEGNGPNSKAHIETAETI